MTPPPPETPSPQTTRPTRSELLDAPLSDEELERAEKMIGTLAHYLWHKETRPGDHLWSIPVDPSRDFDVLFSRALDELKNLRAENFTLIAASATNWSCSCGAKPHQYDCAWRPNAALRRYEEAEASCCPEDVGLVEYVKLLEARGRRFAAEHDEARQEIARLKAENDSLKRAILRADAEIIRLENSLEPPTGKAGA